LDFHAKLGAQHLELVRTLLSEAPTALTDKPQSDWRNYQTAVLANGLRVVNIQDEKSTVMAAAMGVMSGSFNDPAEFSGLAHFCEHMLFLGSKRYPSPTGFNDFLSANGGDSNAFTAN
jgi:insulysin